MSSDGQDTPPVPSSSEVSLGVRIDRICGEFENLLKAGKSPKIETYLSEVPENHRRTLLEELLGLELDYRAKAGDSFTSEEYTLRFPEHATSVVELVVNVRQEKPAEVKSPSVASTSARNDSSSSAQTSRSDRPIRIGPYEIIEPCGKGGMGVVYKAWHEFFKQFRAIKVLPSDFDDDDISRFSMEIELAGRLNHPNIVRAHEANREQGILYLVMEFVEGINLDHLVKHHKQLPLGLACEMIRQAAEGLQHADEHFLVHRDIKPSNLMVNRQGQVKILDFGLARLHAEQHASRLTKHGSVMGTLDFMAPEQWEDPMGATIQADIYSLGCTLYYLVTGTPPYGGESYSHWLKKQDAHRNEPVPRVDHDQGELLQPIINRMMAKSVQERFTSPAEIVEALAPLADGSELVAYAETPAPKVAASALSRTPIPTVNVSTSELHELAHESFGDDSEPNSGAKTMRPHQSRTDIDSERQFTEEARPKKPAWHKTSVGRGGLAVLAVVLLIAGWFWLRPAQNVKLAVQMGALPGLNGGLHGDWWFAEMPWYSPGVRQEFMKALRKGEKQIAGVSLEDLETRLASADTESLQADLKTIASVLIRRLPGPEQSWAGQIFDLPQHTNPEAFDTGLLNILKDEFDGELDVSQSTLEERSPSELHFLANILHFTSTNHSEYASLTEKVYRAAESAYDEDDEVEFVLRAVARSDHSRFLADRRDYPKSIFEARKAIAAVPNAPLFQISVRCELADSFRKLDGDSKNALAQLTGSENSASAWADQMGLAENHPLRAEILERRAWINVDGWHMKRALEDFGEATDIRERNQELGNSFAWRPLLLNQQGQAMAHHFLGNDEKAIAIYQELEATITDPSKGSKFATESELESRLPNIRERFGDVYLVDASRAYDEAAKKYRMAAFSASLDNGFGESATLWFHLARLHYKHWLADMLGKTSSGATNVKPRDDAEELIAKYQNRTSPEAFEKQAAAYRLEKQVAEAMQKLGEDDAENGLADLLNVIKTYESKASRSNIEVLLVAIEQWFHHREAASDEDVIQVCHSLLEATELMRRGDPEIRRYLEPVIHLAHEAIEALPGDQSEEMAKRLKNAMPLD